MAFIGTPCQCRAINKMKFLYIKPAHVIKYVIGLFCFENFIYTQLYDILKRETRVYSTNIKITWIKKNFFFQTKDNKEFVGASGAPKGYSMILIRTNNGEKLVNNMLSRGIIQQYVVPFNKTIEWKNKKLNWYNKLISLKRRNNIAKNNKINVIES